MTGHLVLFTLHTNDAPSAVSRLIDMGVEPFLITSSLTLVMGQRLGRVPCSRRSEPVEADPGPWGCSAWTRTRSRPRGCARAAAAASAPRPATGAAWTCSRCSPVTRKIRELIVARATEAAIKVLVVAAGHLDEGLLMVDADRPDLVLVDHPA
jgi:type II secretory ATPase GspE/PulE/Tfp pilus assembly ATPase PilB-like protein